MKLNANAFGLAVGVVLGLVSFVATLFSLWFGAGQTITMLVPVDGGTLVFYVNHSFVDRWSGPGFTAGARPIFWGP